MYQFPLPLTQLILENLSVVMTFAYSRVPLERLRQDQFPGEWKALEKSLFEISEDRATKALIELGIFMRHLDDAEGISKTLPKAGWDFGKLTCRDGRNERLSLRDVANKLLHSVSFVWDLSDEASPRLICNAQESQKQWEVAEINVVTVAAACGLLLV